jgi:hypothetical protein
MSSHAIIEKLAQLDEGLKNLGNPAALKKLFGTTADGRPAVVLNLSKAIYGSPDICKTWYFDAEVNGFAFKGYLVASFCGTVSDPTSRYDLCFVIS